MGNFNLASKSYLASSGTSLSFFTPADIAHFVVDLDASRESGRIGSSGSLLHGLHRRVGIDVSVLSRSTEAWSKSGWQKAVIFWSTSK
jgi:hypothetical protein